MDSSKLERSRPNSEDDFAIILPEILGKIMSLLSPRDIIACSLVNVIWEKEARRSLLTRKTLRLSIDRVEEYQKLEGIRPNYHNSIILSNSEAEDPINFLPFLINIMKRNYNTLKQITIPWSLEREKTPNGHYETFKMFAGCPNLTWIGLMPFRNFEKCIYLRSIKPLESFYKEIIPAPELFDFVKVTTLEIDLSRVAYFSDEHKAPFVKGLFSRLGLIFPNVEHLKCSYFGRSVIASLFRNDPVPFGNLKFLSIDSSAQFYSEYTSYIRVFGINELQVVQNYLTKLSLTWDTRMDGNFSFLMQKFCKTLKYLQIQVVDGGPADLKQWWKRHLLIPVMPVLKELKVSLIHKVNPIQDPWPYRYLSFNEMDTFLKSEMGFNYSTRFPCLVNLTISGDLTSRINLGLSAMDYFSILATFMSHTFIPMNCTNQCRTLKKLVIPLPPGVKFRLRNFVKCNCNGEKGLCECWVAEESFAFMEHVKSTFPNAKLAQFG